MKRLASIAFIFPLLAFAQEQTPAPPAASATPAPSKRLGLQSSSNVRINYGRASWNRDPKDFDTASIIMREGSTGRTVQISLTETTQDSAVFSGLYNISFQNMERLQTEFYIPDQDALSKPNSMKKIMADISGGKLQRNPFILRRQPNGLQSVEIFDTKEQAREAMKAYKAEQMVALQGGTPTKIPSDQAMATAALAADLQEKQAQAAALAERQRIAQIEAQRLAELQAKQAAVSAAEKAANQKKAKTLADEAMKLFQVENYTAAKEKFDQAVALDPDNQLFYFQFGVTLYRVEDYNRSLVMLKLSNDKSVNLLERDYFVGLNHFKLKEYENSVAAFDRIVATKDPVMGPSAEFYKGVVFFEQRMWEPAQKSFQGVLDNSKDPKLDERAEAYLEQILRIRQFEEEAKKKWILSATFGETYDSNILLIADSQRDTGSASNTAGYRSLFTGSARYRPIYEETREFAAQLDLVTMYTVTQSFQGDQSLRNTDPTVATLTLPWTHKGLLWGKGHKMDITPGYESTYMSIENNENKEILSSILFSGTNLIVFKETWFGNFNLDIRQDTSKLSSSVGDDDSSAVKVKFSTSHILINPEDKQRMWIPEGAFTINEAKGKNANYTRFDWGISYIRPWKWETSASFKLGYFNINYAQNSTGRADNSYTFTSGLSKKLTDIWSTGLLASYNINQSNQTSNTYNKLTALVTFSAQTGF